MKITATRLETLMYDLPLLLAASRGRRKVTMYGAAAQIGIAGSTVWRIEQGYSCDVRILIRILRWLETE